MRLIDADALKKLSHEEWDGVLVWDESGETTADEFCNLVDCIPTADVRENVHAHWVIKREQMPNGEIAVGQFCSNCDYPQYLTTRFCPNCGAVMDERSEE